MQFVALSDDAASLPFMDGHFYRFAHYPGLPEFRELLTRARAKDRAAYPATKEEKVTRVVLPDGARGPLPKAAAGPVVPREGRGVKPDALVVRAKAKETAAAIVDADDGIDGATATAAVRNRVQAGTDVDVGDDVWLLAENGPFGAAGTELVLKSGDVVVDAKSAIVVRDSGCVRLARVPKDGVDAFLSTLPLASDTVGRVRKDGGATAAPDSAAKPDGGVPGAEPSDDLRTLWVDFDSHGKRFKEWKEAVAEMRAGAFEDFPLDGPVSVLDICGYMRRNGGDPQLWMDLWVRNQKIDVNDRILHEVRALVKCLMWGATYDQLNLPALASMEVVARRLQQIMDAYAKPGAPPNWEFARYLGGQQDLADGVSRPLRAWAVRTAKDDADIAAARVRGITARAPGARPDGQGGGAGGSGGGGGDQSAGAAAAGGGGAGSAAGAKRGGRLRRLQATPAAVPP